MKDLDLRFIVTEAITNIRRNLTLTAATTLTVAVSLSLVGTAVLLRHGVNNATQQWQGGIEFIIYMNPDADPDHIDTLTEALTEDPNVKTHRYLDHDAAYDEFVNLFGRDNPRLTETITPDVLPTNFKVVPTDPTANSIQTLIDTYSTHDDVYRIIAATDTIKTMQRVSEVVSTGILAGAVTLTAAAVVLVINTIRAAMTARRREIEVMRLVGASNWFIRVPFLLEGMIQGILGAAVAVTATITLNNVFETRLAATGIELLRNFVVDPTDVTRTSIWLVAAGVTIGAGASMLAIRRHLDI